mmetsp:Transcript_32104/g.56354  ORF Transcript_32104/g.56354 Transcript_32104/m.56354 type:complete len:284 (+) Transcript_32104:94-945(+)
MMHDGSMTHLSIISSSRSHVCAPIVHRHTALLPASFSRSLTAPPTLLTQLLLFSKFLRQFLFFWSISASSTPGLWYNVGLLALNLSVFDDFNKERSEQDLGFGICLYFLLDFGIGFAEHTQNCESSRPALLRTGLWLPKYKKKAVEYTNNPAMNAISNLKFKNIDESTADINTAAAVLKHFTILSAYFMISATDSPTAALLMIIAHTNGLILPKDVIILLSVIISPTKLMMAPQEYNCMLFIIKGARLSWCLTSHSLVIPEKADSHELQNKIDAPIVRLLASF